MVHNAPLLVKDPNTPQDKKGLAKETREFSGGGDTLLGTRSARKR